MRILLIILSCHILISSCSNPVEKKPQSNRIEKGINGGEIRTISLNLSIPKKSMLNNFDSNKLEVLKRYLKGNGRWEYVTAWGETYAFQKELKNGIYSTTFNGKYSERKDPCGFEETRVIISIGPYYGYHNNENCLTFSTVNNNEKVKLKIEEFNKNPTKISSCLIIKGKGFNIEIFEENCDLTRQFTKQTIEKLDIELSKVIQNGKMISKKGKMLTPMYYPQKIDSTFINVIDSYQKGIYIVQAGYKIKEEGEIHIRAYDTKSNRRLSKKNLLDKTTVQAGWDIEGTTVFPFEREIMIIEGDWSTHYEVRFELWFINKKGKEEKKINQTIRKVYGWQH